MNRMGGVQSMAQFDDGDFLIGLAGKTYKEKRKDRKKDKKL
jgi:hypothetical protein